MTTHLPECWATDPSDPPAWCICDELRACEKRVLDAAGSLTHACPPSGSGIMPCCGRTPFDGMICQCDVIVKVRDDMLAKCIAADRHQNRPGVQYAQAYREGRQDAFTAVAIYLAMRGFHPDDEQWVEAFRVFTVEGGSM